MREDITVLTTVGPTLTKTWHPDHVADYDDAKHYTAQRHSIASLDDLLALLLDLQTRRRSCIIRGKPREGVDITAKHRRLLVNYEDQPSRLFMLDVDGFSLRGSFDESINALLAELPAELANASCIWQASASYGHPTKQGSMRGHLWFWLEEPVSCETAEAVAKLTLPKFCDPVVNRVVQPNYTALPAMAPGVVYTVPPEQRLRLIDGWDSARLPAVTEAQRLQVAQAGAGRQDRHKLVDPREKLNIVGAFCSLYAPEDIVTLAPEQFEAGDDPTRITWLAGGGSKAGIGVSSSGTHLFNTHASSPCGDRALNTFDFLRVHLFGYLDGDLEMSDMLQLGGRAESVPSFAAMARFALEQDGVEEELRAREQQRLQERAQEGTQRPDSPKKELTLADAAALQEQFLREVAEPINNCSSSLLLERTVCPEISGKAWLSVGMLAQAADLVIRRVQALDGVRLSKSAAEKMLRRKRTANVEDYPHVTADGAPKGTIENLRVLLARRGATVRYDAVRHDVVVTLVGHTSSLENSREVSYAMIQSFIEEEGILAMQDKLPGYLTAIADSEQYNPVLGWLGDECWDGVDRIDALLDTLVLADEADRPRARAVLRRWLIQCIALVASPVPLQGRGVLVLQGPQNVGKTRWLQSLVEDQTLVRSGLVLRTDNKDSIALATNVWLCELGELDATFRKSDIAAIKSFLSMDVDTLRAPFARTERSRQRRTSFFASVNDDEFLHDSTGNSRFWGIAIEDIRPNTVDMRQLWRQALALWRGGESHYATPAEMAMIEMANEQFEASDVVMEKLGEFLALDAARALPAGSKLSDSPDLAWVSACATHVLMCAGVTNPNRADLTRAGRLLDRSVKHLSDRGKSRRVGSVNRKLWPVSASVAAAIQASVEAQSGGSGQR